MSDKTEAPMFVVVGPTASGKTALSIELAERLNGEVVSADSIQVYRHFDLGSGKPSAQERARATHHLVDCVDPLESMDAQRYAELAGTAIKDVRSRGRTPIVCGGTFLWVRALVEGLAPAPPSSSALREEHQELAAKAGREAVHAQLALVDPTSAARLAPNDFVRVSRALEVFVLTGKPLSAWHADHGFRTVRYPHRLVGIDIPRDELDRRIRARASSWLEGGWLDEVLRLETMGFDQARAMGSVGYKQVYQHLHGQISRELLLDEVVKATRVFVRRQRTWLRDRPVTWIRGPEELETILG